MAASTSRVSHFLRLGGDEIRVSTWGDPARPAIMLWHGLARTGRDFDELAADLSDRWFVLCPDTLGRGLSSWANDPTTDYTLERYGDHAIATLDHFVIDRLAWLGTSMGGLIGILLAAGRLKDRLTHFIVNDVGPEIPADAIARIVTYVGNPPVVATIAELKAWLRRAYAPFGTNPDRFWQRMIETSLRRMDDGQVTLHYDPKIVAQFGSGSAQPDIWQAWDAITTPTLLVRGERSDVLPRVVAEHMTRRGPRPRLVEFADVGHAPTFTTPRQITAVRAFLEA